MKHHSNIGLWVVLALMVGAGGWWLWSRRESANA
jgi:LPXTG-motif cell wall-anchored protein